MGGGRSAVGVHKLMYYDSRWCPNASSSPIRCKGPSHREQVEGGEVLLAQR
jgi:hypothetical protein